MTMASDHLPRLTLRGRGIDTLRLAKSGSLPDEQPSAHDDLVFAHEQLNAPQFGMRYAKKDIGYSGGRTPGFQVETRRRFRSNKSG